MSAFWMVGYRPGARLAGAIEEGPARARSKQSFTAKLHRDAVADLAAIETALADPVVQVVDARSAERFPGRGAGARAGLPNGHMPGSVSLPFGEIMENGRLKDEASIRDALERHAIDPQRPVITFLRLWRVGGDPHPRLPQDRSIRLRRSMTAPGRNGLHARTRRSAPAIRRCGGERTQSLPMRSPASQKPTPASRIFFKGGILGTVSVDGTARITYHDRLETPPRPRPPPSSRHRNRVPVRHRRHAGNRVRAKYPPSPVGVLRSASRNAE